MNVVFISPYFPFNYFHFCSHLSHLGINVLGIDQMPFDHLHQPLRTSLKDYYRVNDLHNYHELVQACDYFVNRHGPIHRLESHNEHWLHTQAKLASQFQIPGLNNDQIEKVKRKSEMKKVFHSAGLNPAKGDLVPTLDAALQLSSKLGYPVMLKPDIGVGAFGCRKIHHENELKEFFNFKYAQDYLMEEFIHGDIYSFDGLVDRDGQIIFCTSHVYCAGIAEIVQGQLDQYYYSLRELPPELEKIGRETVQAYQVKERFFHFEYFYTHREKHFIPIEVNMRPPGGPTLDMCNYACDIDLYKWWAELIAGDTTKKSFNRKYHCMAICRRYKNSYAHTHDEIMDKGRGLIVHHENAPSLFYATMGDFFYIARSKDLEELFELQRFIQKHR